MATVAGVKIKPKSKRITSTTIRENAKKDHSPKWDAIDTMNADQFMRHWHGAMEYYRLEFSGKDMKPTVLRWMAENDYTKEVITQFKKSKDWRCHVTMGSIAHCLLRGMPAVRADFNNGKSTADWLRESIAKVLEDAKYDVDEEAVEAAKEKAKVDIYVPTIQDRLRESAGAMSEELDVAIDQFCENPDAFDAKAFKIPNLLRGKGVKSAHARLIKQYFAPGHAELVELSSGEADEQLREGYSHLPRKNVKKLLEFYELIMTACDQLTLEAKVNKKPRAKKIVPAEKLVAKLKFQKLDDALGIVSAPPASIVGAQHMFVYNTKTRKIGYYIATTSAGFGVKGTTILNFTDKSTQKTMRKPAEQLKAFKDLNTQKRMQMWFDKEVKTTEIKLNGRFNEETVILKVYK